MLTSYKLNFNFRFFQKVNPHIAHIGVGIAIVGITFSSVFKNEFTYNIVEGENFKINNTDIVFDKIETTNEKNFQSLRANFLISKNKKVIGNVKAGKNYYPVSKMITTEAGIFHEWFRDVYFILGEQKDNEWLVKVHVNPFVSFIWVGVIIMVYSGLIGVSRR